MINGVNAKMRFLAQTKGRREKEKERKRKGKEEEGKGRGGKGEREREIGSSRLGRLRFFPFLPKLHFQFPFPFLLSLLFLSLPLPFPSSSFPFPSPFDLSFMSMMLAPWYPDEESAVKMLNFLNSKHPTIQFEMELLDTEGFLPILDIKMNIGDDGRVERNLFCKAVNKGLTLNYTSHHPRSTKNAIARNEIQSVARPRNTNNLQSPSYAQSYRKTITRKAHSNHLSPRRTSHHVLSSSHLCIFQYLSCRTNLTMVCNVFLISTRLMRVCVTLVAELSSRPRPGRAHPRPSPARVENAAHPKSATGATSSTKLRACFANLPTSV